MQRTTKNCEICAKVASLYELPKLAKKTLGDEKNEISIVDETNVIVGFCFAIIDRSQYWRTCQCNHQICNHCCVQFDNLTNAFCSKCIPFSSYTITPSVKICQKCNVTAVHGDKEPDAFCGSGIIRDLYWSKCDCKLLICSDCRVSCNNCTSTFCKDCFDAHVYKLETKKQTCNICNIEQTLGFVDFDNETGCGFDGHDQIYWQMCTMCNLLRCVDCSLHCKCDEFIDFCPTCHECNQMKEESLVT